jgi:hypothetical protein
MGVVLDGKNLRGRNFVYNDGALDFGLASCWVYNTT